jgi:hypothetical protein
MDSALADGHAAPRPRACRGMTTPTLDVALALSRELGESVEALFGGGR